MENTIDPMDGETFSPIKLEDAIIHHTHMQLPQLSPGSLLGKHPHGLSAKKQSRKDDESPQTLNSTPSTRLNMNPMASPKGKLNDVNNEDFNKRSSLDKENTFDSINKYFISSPQFDTSPFNKKRSLDEEKPTPVKYVKTNANESSVVHLPPLEPKLTKRSPLINVTDMNSSIDRVYSDDEQPDNDNIIDEPTVNFRVDTDQIPVYTHAKMEEIKSGLDKQIDDLRIELKHKNQDFEDLKTQMNAKDSEISRLKSNVEDLEFQINRLKSVKDSLETRLNVNCNDNAKLSKKLAVKDKNLELAQVEIKELQQKIEDLNGDILEQSEFNKFKHSTIDELEKTRLHQQDEYQVINDEKESIEQEKQKLDEIRIKLNDFEKDVNDKDQKIEEDRMNLHKEKEQLRESKEEFEAEKKKFEDMMVKENEVVEEKKRVLEEQFQQFEENKKIFEEENKKLVMERTELLQDLQKMEKQAEEDFKDLDLKKDEFTKQQETFADEQEQYFKEKDQFIKQKQQFETDQQQLLQQQQEFKINENEVNELKQKLAQDKEVLQYQQQTLQEEKEQLEKQKDQETSNESEFQKIIDSQEDTINKFEQQKNLYEERIKGLEQELQSKVTHDEINKEVEEEVRKLTIELDSKNKEVETLKRQNESKVIELKEKIEFLKADRDRRIEGISNHLFKEYSKKHSNKVEILKHKYKSAVDKIQIEKRHLEIELEDLKSRLNSPKNSPMNSRR
ncbi:kinetochore protein Slk19p [[Candida] jaroonii]|uniref:Kinetochore protein Slk19p n=1 Tax=[Candida] jaroonii TaxID=467808 RepID=A0ACA9Y488_9ASCO|nr:kinetochore protein Slk19p [[Candida] jaroonii]